MPSPQIQFRAVPPLGDALAARNDDDSAAALSDTARVSLTMHFRLLAAELRTVRLTRNEALAIIDALNSVFIDEIWAESGNMCLAAELQDAGELDDLAGKWDINLAGLVETVRQWSPGQALAVVDAAKRWWRLPDGVRDFDAGLVAVRLQRPKPALSDPRQ